MKSHQLPTKSSYIASSRRFVRRASGSFLAAALMLGLGAGHLLAQGGYYPGSPYGNTPVTPAPAFPTPYTFTPSGEPITSNSDLGFINAKLGGLYPTKTLILPPPAGFFSPTDAEYQAAVAAAGKDAADGVAPVGVTVFTLAGEVSNYRSTTGLINNALGALAGGVISSTASVPSRQIDLQNIAAATMRSNPAGIGGIGSTRLVQVFTVASQNVDFLPGVGAILKAALDAAPLPVPGTPGLYPAASLLTPTGVNALVTDAISKINTGNALLGNPTANADLLIKTTVAGVGGAISSTTVTSSVGNLDAASRAAMTWLGTYGVGGQLSMATAIVAAVPGATPAQEGAIAQGALRWGATATINGAFTSAYAKNIVSDGNSLIGLPPGGPWPALVGTPESIAAAAMVRFGSGVPSTNAALGYFFSAVAGPLPPGAPTRAVIEAAVGANQINASTIATTSVGLGIIPALPDDVAFGAIRGALIQSAGAIARAVVALPSVNTDPVRISVATASMQAVTPAGYADVAYNIGNQLRLAGPVGLATNTAVMNAAQAVVGVADRYLSVVSYVAGNFKANPTLSTTATPTTPAGDAAIAVANTLINSIVPGSALANYNNTYNALTDVTLPSPEKTKARMLAASQANSADVVGALAAATLASGAGAVSAAELTNLAVNANRTRQFSIVLGATVANELNTNPAANIQHYVGRQIINNPSNQSLNDIVTAATVVKAQNSHFVAHAASFNAPTNVNTAIATILSHSRISIPGTLASETIPAARDLLGAGGRPAAIAAIAAGLTTGLRENTQITGVTKTNALYNLVSTLVTQVYLTGGSGQYNDAAGAGAPAFRQRTIVGGLPGVTVTKATGIAGAVTGFVAQMVQPGATTLDSDLANALRGAGIGAGGLGNLLVVAQAAGQAYGWVSGIITNPVLESAIATAITGTYAGTIGGLPTLAAVNSAVSFGFSEANGGVGPLARPGAGAAGLRDNSGSPLYTPSGPYYNHSSATGTPVSNIFTL